jgi:hypothetical protein
MYELLNFMFYWKFLTPDQKNKIALETTIDLFSVHTLTYIIPACTNICPNWTRGKKVSNNNLLNFIDNHTQHTDLFAPCIYKHFLLFSSCHFACWMNGRHFSIYVALLWARYRHNTHVLVQLNATESRWVSERERVKSSKLNVW